MVEWCRDRREVLDISLASIKFCFGFCFLSLTALELHCCKQATLLAVVNRLLNCFSSCRARALRCMGFSSCGSWTQLPHGTWNLPQPEIKPVSPVLAGGFLTTGPSGTSHWVFSDLKKTTLQASDKLFWWIPWPQFPQMKNKECGLNSTPRCPRKFQEWVWGTALCSSSTRAAIFYLLPKFCF